MLKNDYIGDKFELVLKNQELEEVEILDYNLHKRHDHSNDNGAILIFFF